jgi:hypothetical protein
MVRLLIRIITIGLLGALMTGCALRVSVTPIQAEELVQKSVTNQFFDWLWDTKEGNKS